MKRSIRIGSRRSRLAQKQAEMCRDALLPFVAEGTEITLHIFQTTGDSYLAGNLSEIGNKGLFTKEIEQALQRNEIDIAVHSMKDMATTPPQDLLITAMLPRDDVRDVLLAPHAGHIAALPVEAVVGTSSLRRAVQLRYHRPDVQIVNYRGNLDRRIANLEEGQVDATLLAAAGLDRLGMKLPYATAIEVEEMLPAVAQGAIGLQCRSEDSFIRVLCEQVNHLPTFHAVTIERIFLKELDGSCRTPIAGYAVQEGDIITLQGLLASHDARYLIRDRISAPLEDAAIAAQELAHHLTTWLHMRISS